MTEEERLSRRTRFTQVSLFSVLLSGRYGGVITISELKKLGNMAIATMDRLDGEMQMIDGVVYQACADGHVYLPDDDATIFQYKRASCAIAPQPTSRSDCPMRQRSQG